MFSLCLRKVQVNLHSLLLAVLCRYLLWFNSALAEGNNTCSILFFSLSWAVWRRGHKSHAHQPTPIKYNRKKMSLMYFATTKKIKTSSPLKQTNKKYIFVWVKTSLRILCFHFPNNSKEKKIVKLYFLHLKKFQTFFSFSYLRVLTKAVHLRFNRKILSLDMLCCTHQLQRSEIT